MIEAQLMTDGWRVIVGLRVFEGGLTVKSSSKVEVNGERWKVRDVSMRSCLRRTGGVQGAGGRRRCAN